MQGRAEYATIPFLSPDWIVGIMLSATVMVLVLWVGRRLAPRGRELGSWALAATSAIQWVALEIYTWQAGFFTLEENLPFHLCGVSGFLAIWLMLAPRQLLYELVYYWGITGAFHAMMTPVLNLGDTTYLRIDFFVGHGIIILIALWATLVLGMRPRPGSWWRVFLWTQLLLPSVLLINWLLDANYMFLCEPPDTTNPLIIGDFPEHILGYEVAAIVHFVLLYLPFGLRRRGPASEETP